MRQCDNFKKNYFSHWHETSKLRDYTGCPRICATIRGTQKAFLCYISLCKQLIQLCCLLQIVIVIFILGHPVVKISSGHCKTEKIFVYYLLSTYAGSTYECLEVSDIYYIYYGSPKNNNRRRRKILSSISEMWNKFIAGCNQQAFNMGIADMQYIISKHGHG